MSVNDAHVAQSVEHFLGKGEVIGSNPIAGSSLRSFGASTGAASLGCG